MTVQDDRVAAFHRLHASGCFVMPNPWDVGSARALEQIGFQALATTSAGFAWTLGRADNHAHARRRRSSTCASSSAPCGAGERGLRGRLRGRSRSRSRRT